MYAVAAAIRELTFSTPLVSNGYTSKRSAPYWSNPLFKNFFWHSGTLALSSDRQRAWMSEKV